MQQSSHTVVGISVIVILLALYSLKKSPTVIEIKEDDGSSVSVCQLHVQYNEFNTFDDRTILSLLATLKMHDFQIGQPVWGPSDTLLYLCEHRLKTGLKQTIIDKELNNIIKNSGSSSTHFAWSCA